MVRFRAHLFRLAPKTYRSNDDLLAGTSLSFRTIDNFRAIYKILIYREIS